MNTVSFVAAAIDLTRRAMGFAVAGSVPALARPQQGVFATSAPKQWSRFRSLMRDR